MRYVAFIHRDDAGFGVSFPDFPGCVSIGDTVDDAVRRGGEALAFHVAGIYSDGRDDPGAPLHRRHQGRPGPRRVAARRRLRADPPPPGPRIFAARQHFSGPRPARGHRPRSEAAPHDPVGLPGDSGSARDRGHIAGRTTHYVARQRDAGIEFAPRDRTETHIVWVGLRALTFGPYHCQGAGFSCYVSSNMAGIVSIAMNMLSGRS